MTTREICEYALISLKREGADMAQCSAAQVRLDEMNVLAGKMKLMRTVFTTSINMKAVKNQKKGTVSINKAEKADIDEAVKACLTAAEASVTDEAEGISELIENKSFISGDRECDKEKLYFRITELIDTVAQKYPQITLDDIIGEFECGESVFMNSNGVEFTDNFGSYAASVTFSAHEGEKGSSCNYYGFRLDNLNKPFIENGLTDSLLEQITRSIDTVPVQGKFNGTVVFTPASVQDMLGAIIGNFLTDGSLIDGTSIWKNKLGEKVASGKFTLRIDPLAEGIVKGGNRITGDGYFIEPLDIIVNGKLVNYLLSRYGSAKTGLKRTFATGNFIYIEPGEDSYEDMLSGIKRGLMIGRLSGGSPAANGEFSGVAKNSFIINDGKLGEAVSETMISLNFAEAVKNITAISKETVNDGTGAMPWVSVSDVTISGK